MAKIRNTHGYDVVVPALGGRLVLDGQIVEVADDLVESFTHPSAPSAGWAPSDKAAKDIHAAAVKAAEPTGEDESEPAPEEG